MRRLFLTSSFEVWYRPASGTTPATCVFGEASGDPPALDELRVSAPEPVGLALADDAPRPGLVSAALRPLFGILPSADYAVAVEAAPIAEWRRIAAFCGVCGARTERDPAERCMVCPACRHRIYPRVNPAVITCIRRGNSVLLAERVSANGPFFSLIAGFVEAGESLEHAVCREVREEVGISVQNLRYAESQPWPYRNNLMLGFFSDYAAGEIVPDGVEIKKAAWFPLDALPPNLPAPLSIARRLIDSAVRDMI